MQLATTIYSRVHARDCAGVPSRAVTNDHALYAEGIEDAFEPRTHDVVGVCHQGPVPQQRLRPRLHHRIVRRTFRACVRACVRAEKPAALRVREQVSMCRDVS